MALDAAMLNVTAIELLKNLLSARVDKIYSPTRDEIVMTLRTESRNNVALFISARSGSARIHITKESFENPLVPPAFCMLLRKHLSTGRISNIFLKDGERICFIVFDAVNDMGDKVKLTLSIELMGRYSNLVMFDESGRIIDALKRVDDEASDKRRILPGLNFTMPPRQEKLLFFTTSAEILAKKIIENKRSLSSAILNTAAGIGPLTAREIAFRVSPQDKDSDCLSAEEEATLIQEIENFKQMSSGLGNKFSIIYDKEKPVEFSFFDILQYGSNVEKRYFDTASEMFDCYFSEKDRLERAKNKSHNLKKQLTTIYERTLRREQSRREELLSADKAETKKLYGELLTANLGRITERSEKATVLNYYTGEQVTIPLDIRLSANANAQKYYKDYRKLMVAKGVLEKLIEDGKNEIKYLSSVLYETNLAKTEEEFLNIRRELKDAGFLRSYKLPKQKPQKIADFIEFKSSSGYKILVGKNNAANEKLSLKIAAKSDIWFHVKNAPGSHVVMFTEKTEPTERDYTEAATIAAYYSSEAFGQMIPVDYTEIKNIKKPANSKPGMVIYHTNYSAFVSADKELVESLKV